MKRLAYALARALMELLILPLPRAIGAFAEVWTEYPYDWKVKR